jgi:hypothetical protein
MTEHNPYWPTEPRAHVAYRPPYGVQQPTRAVALRDVWREVSLFRERFIAPIESEYLMLSTQRWSVESLANEPGMLEWFGVWPPELSRSEFDAAVHLARRRFGEPNYSSDTRERREELEEEHHWHLPLARVDELLEYLETVASCTVGSHAAPVSGRYGCPFWLRDPTTGVVLPGQSRRHFPVTSQLDVELRQRSTASLQLIIPFAEPDETTADFVMTVQEYAPVWIDPRYFNHLVPETDDEDSERLYRRRRLAPEWIGRTATGELRLDASRSGIVPQVLNLPTAEDLANEDREADLAPYRENFYAVYGALREHSAAALLVRGPTDGYMVEQAAMQLGLPIHKVNTLRSNKDAPSVAETIRTLVWGLEDRPAVLLVELMPQRGERTANQAILAQMATRTLDRATLPPSVRLVVIEATLGSDATRKAGELEAEARREGFATREQLDYLDRRHSAAAYRDVEVIPVPYAP